MASNASSDRAAPLPLPLDGAAPRQGIGTLGLELALLGALALCLRVVWLGAEIHIDELYHVIPAESWLRSGEFRIGAGTFERGWLFTLVIAWFIDHFGDTLLVARLPSVLAATALVLLVFLWTRRVAGPLAGWTAGLLLMLSPIAVETAQLARFYALHALLFWLVALAAWRIAEPGLRRGSRLTAAGLGLGAALIALHLQVLTLIGVAGLGLWLAGLALPDLWRRLPASRTTRLGLLLGAGALAAAVLAVLVETGVVAQLVERYRFTSLWAEASKNRPHFYHMHLLEDYPLPWSLTPLLAIAALGFRRRAAAFCATVFGTAFLCGSLAGMKDDRYLLYALPFLFALWGMGCAALGRRVLQGAGAVIARTVQRAAPWLPERPARAALLGLTLAFLAFASGAPARLGFDLVQRELPSGPGRLTADWDAAGPVLAPWLARADVVVTSDELVMLHHVGDPDVLISGTRLSEIGEAQEFTIDPRTGVIVISARASLEALLQCHATGLAVLSTRDLVADWSVRRELRDLLVARAERIALPGLAELEAYWWQRPGGQGPACPMPVRTARHFS